MTMKNITIYVSVLGMLLFISKAIAVEANSCPAVDCDCTSLPREAWQDYCYTYELKLKQSCTANNNVPTDYCSLHGPGATPLPLALSTESPAKLPASEMDASVSRVKNTFRGMEGDISTLRNKVSSLWFADAIALLKKIDADLDTVYGLERQVSAQWIATGQASSAESHWADFAKSSEGFAEGWREYGDQLWEMYLAESSPQAKAAYRVIAFRVMRLSGKSYEMAAEGFGRTGKYKRSAKLWTEAAAGSKLVMARKESSGAKKSHVGFYRLQASSRMNRATYYWALDNNEDGVVEALAQAQALSGQAEMQTLLADQEEDPTISNQQAN
ncbi:hypothetical protein [Teredinibacter turnerae]|uniref:hypothetical protein n=1 Tax=Teredinibacter turnerae TaxID=2426 RepID=UPI0030D62E0D